MRVKPHELKDDQRIETLDVLYTAAAAVEGRESTKAFLKDLLTESERIMLGRRIMIARRLLAKEGPASIAADLKVGFDTIYRVQRWLHDQLPGYEKAVEEMEKEFDRRKEKSRKTPDGNIDRKLYATNAWYRLKKRYPASFWIFPDPK